MNKSCALHFHDLHVPASDFRQDILTGLQAEHKHIAPKYFYDAEGSRLFDEICQLPEYYLTRTEIALLKRHGPEIAACLGPDVTLLELGSGSSVKIRLLLEALQPLLYVPVDISREHLLQSAKTLAEDFPWLTVHAICGDYAVPCDWPVHAPPNSRRIAYFPGSSIGNFTPRQALKLLGRIAALLGDGGGLLIGVDLIKDREILEAAYDDSQGVTARFNKNILARLNRELQSDFSLAHFLHRAFYNAGEQRIEMHLLSDCEQKANVGSEIIHFCSGETIHTENSYKYSISGFQQLAMQAGFEPRKVWVDADELFSIHYLKVRKSIAG